MRIFENVGYVIDLIDIYASNTKKGNFATAYYKSD